MSIEVIGISLWNDIFPNATIQISYRNPLVYVALVLLSIALFEFHHKSFAKNPIAARSNACIVHAEHK